MKKMIFATCVGIFLTSCMNQDNNKLETIDKANAREVAITTVVHGDTVYHLVKQRIWANNELVLAKIDTLKTPATLDDLKKPGKSTDLKKIPIYVTVE